MFAGTARYDSRYRPGYPPAVFDLLAREASLGLRSAALDLGCGTGQVALELAARVAAAIAVDVDQGMLDEAARLADAGGHHNIRFVRAKAEDFNDADGAYRLVVIASAFHWMDRATVAAHAHQLLEPGGVLAVIGTPTPLDQIRRREGIGRVVAAVQDRWLKSSQLPAAASELARHEAVIATSPFGQATIAYIPTEQHWDVPRLVGFLRSTSWRPDQVLGDRFAAFAADLEAAILSVEPTGRWTYHANVEIILARHKPTTAT